MKRFNYIFLGLAAIGLLLPLKAFSERDSLVAVYVPAATDFTYMPLDKIDFTKLEFNKTVRFASTVYSFTQYNLEYVKRFFQMDKKELKPDDYTACSVASYVKFGKSYQQIDINLTAGMEQRGNVCAAVKQAFRDGDTIKVTGQFMEFPARKIEFAAGMNKDFIFKRPVAATFKVDFIEFEKKQDRGFFRFLN